MTGAVKSMSDMDKLGFRPQPTRMIGNKLSKLLAVHGFSLAEAGRAIGTSGSAVGHAAQGTNGAGFATAWKLAFLFDTSVDALADTGVFDVPKNPAFDQDARDLYVLELKDVIGGLRQPTEFKVDLMRRADTYLAARGLLGADGKEPVSQPEPAQITLFDTTPKTEAEQIKVFLMEAEVFRCNTDLEWVIRENGSLGARRVTTEEF